VYRGSKLSRDEVEKLRTGKLVSCNEFLSSTQDLDVALKYIGIDPKIGISHSQSREDREQFALFEINVDFTETPDIIVADVSKQSVIPDDHEIIFNLGTNFIINSITYDDKCHLWRIRMSSSSAVADLEMGYVGIIRKRLLEISPTLLFGNLLATISSTYRQGIEFFHRLLHSESVEEKDRSNIYFNLGRIYRYMGKYEQANQHFRHAQQLQEERLPQSTFDYARTLADLGTLYSEMNQPTEAISLITKAMSLHKEILPQDHVEVAFNKNRLAYAYWQKKQYDQALNELLSSISSFKKMPTDHLGYAQALHTMGLVQYSFGNWKQALNDYKEALRMRESLLADDHPYVARTCYELSILYDKHINDYNMALDYAKRALRIRKAKLPRNHNELKKSIELVEYLMQRDNVIESRLTTF
jgi:tetratricopeptide (TPR) repeat protein